jgi:hypothetical protein
MSLDSSSHPEAVHKGLPGVSTSLRFWCFDLVATEKRHGADTGTGTAGRSTEIDFLECGSRKIKGDRTRLAGQDPLSCRPEYLNVTSERGQRYLGKAR